MGRRGWGQRGEGLDHDIGCWNTSQDYWAGGHCSSIDLATTPMSIPNSPSTVVLRYRKVSKARLNTHYFGYHWKMAPSLHNISTLLQSLHPPTLFIRFELHLHSTATSPRNRPHHTSSGLIRHLQHWSILHNQRYLI